VLWRGLRLAGPGSVLGAAAAWASGRLLESRRYGVEAGDLATLAGAVAVLLGAATLACWLPARRAVDIDPLETRRARNDVGSARAESVR
jgi:hypothetical protein